MMPSSSSLSSSSLSSAAAAAVHRPRRTSRQNVDYSEADANLYDYDDEGSTTESEETIPVRAKRHAEEIEREKVVSSATSWRPRRSTRADISYSDMCASATEDELSSAEEVEEEKRSVDDEGAAEIRSEVQRWKMESFVARDSRPAEEWECMHAKFRTHYIPLGGSMDFESGLFECERGCGFESRDREVVERHEIFCDPKVSVERILVKWKGLSYVHCTWETESMIRRTGDKHELAKFDRFLSMPSSPRWSNRENRKALKLRCTVERVVAEESVHDVPRSKVASEASERMVLIKWEGDLDYDKCSWEMPSDLRTARFENDPDVFERRMGEFRDRALHFEEIRRHTKTYRRGSTIVADDDNPYALAGAPIHYRPRSLDVRKRIGGGNSLSPYGATTLPGCRQDRLALRSYQVKGVNWLIRKWQRGTSTILADEMGLGKTVQSCALIDHVARRERLWGSYLVVVPLSTAINWQREFEMWTSMSTVILKGSQDSRDILKQFETFDDRRPRFDVLIATYEMVQLEIEWLRTIEWRLLIVDEAHRVKSKRSKLLQKIRMLRFGGSLLLTGTPLQNSISELWPLLNLLDPEAFDDPDDFQRTYGVIDSTTTNTVADASTTVTPLIRLLKEYMLRRMKGDVERALLPKQETVVEVELTRTQKKYYRALYQTNGAALVKGFKRSMMNIAMELRKCCNHPYLLDSVEELERAPGGDAESLDEVDALVNASGKMSFLDKLLPKLKRDGHRVLIFSQMTRMLDILEDYLSLRQFPFERLDGGVRGFDRQSAIDRFMDAASDWAVFLISTRAGGVGINLTVADTVIIYDSDWNPQNDLQAMARCHRIGQDKQVVVYRLLARRSYEEAMFEAASRKLGLDQAVLHGVTQAKGSSSRMSKEEMARLLKHGAYHALKMGDNATTTKARSGSYVKDDDGDDDDDADGFFDATIDEILQRRTRTVAVSGDDDKVRHRQVSGGILSKATFFSDEHGSIEIDDENFWSKVLGADACAEKTNDADDGLASLERHERASRKRRVDYGSDKYKSFYRAAEEQREDAYEPSSEDEDRGDEDESAPKRKQTAAAATTTAPRTLSIAESLNVERGMLVSKRGAMLPWGNWSAVATALAIVAEGNRRNRRRRYFVRSSQRRSLLLYCAAVRAIAAAEEATASMEGEGTGASSEKTAPTKRKDEIEVDKNDRDDDEIGHALVGRSVRKNFPNFGVFTGRVTEYYEPRDVYNVEYEDGDAEDLTLVELRIVMLPKSSMTEAASSSDASVPSPPSRDRAFDAVDRLKKAHVCFESMLRMREAWHRQVTEFERIKSRIVAARRVLREALATPVIDRAAVADRLSRVALEKAAESESVEERASRARTWLAAERALLGQFLRDRKLWCRMCGEPKKLRKVLNGMNDGVRIADLAAAQSASAASKLWQDVSARAASVETAVCIAEWSADDDGALLRGACKHGRNGDWLKIWADATLGFRARLIDVAASQNEISSEDQAADTAKRLKGFLKRRLRMLAGLHERWKKRRRQEEMRRRRDALKEQERAQAIAAKSAARAERRAAKAREKAAQKRERRRMREEEKEQRAALRKEKRRRRKADARAQKRQRTATSNAETREKKRVRSRSSSKRSRDPSLAGFRVVPPPNTRIRLRQENPKRGMSAVRYEGYKGARTMQEYYELGGSRADARFDISRGHVEILDDAYNVRATLDSLVASVVAGVNHISVPSTKRKETIAATTTTRRKRRRRRSRKQALTSADPDATAVEDALTRIISKVVRREGQRKRRLRRKPRETECEKILRTLVSKVARRMGQRRRQQRRRAQKKTSSSGGGKVPAVVARPVKI